MKSSLLTLTLALGSAAACFSQARAVTVLDQIGSSGAAFTGLNAYSSQFFSDDPTFSLSAVDDFSASSILRLTNVTEATEGFNGFTSYSNVTGYEVNIYSSLTAANDSLDGDVAHVLIGPADATVATSFSGDADSALISLPVSILLPRAGVFYLSVIADLSFGDGGQLGVYGSTGLPGAIPGGTNAYAENPGGDLGLPGNESALGVDLAYRVTADAVPRTFHRRLDAGRRRAARGSFACVTRREVASRFESRELISVRPAPRIFCSATATLPKCVGQTSPGKAMRC